MTIFKRTADKHPPPYPPSESHGIQLKTRQVVIALEHMLSLNGNHDVNHGKRVAYIATCIGEALRYRTEKLEVLFNTSMLHDCGVSTQRLHGALTRTFIPLNVNTQEHCQQGHDLLVDFEPLASCAKAIKYHHTPWRCLKPNTLSPRDAEIANIVFFADRLDTLAQQRQLIDTLAIVEITEKLHTATHSLFSPKIIDAYISLAASKLFWKGMEPAAVNSFVEAHEFALQDTVIAGDDVRKLTHIFGHISDKKSRFTQHHSQSVGLIARFMAERCNLPLPMCEKIEMAGVLHNVGKMHVPDHVLDKAGPLSLKERALLHEHPNHTFDILNHMKGMEDVAGWASTAGDAPWLSHYSAAQPTADLAPSIVKMANAFQALLEDRPYRWGQSLANTLNTLTLMTEQAQFDPVVLEVVCAYPNECLTLARSQ